MIKKTSLLVTIPLLLLTACQSTFGPSAIQNTHNAYNESIVNTLKQQMLLNLVRLKYRDQAYFLKISSVTAALSLGGSLGVEAELALNSGGNILTPNIGGAYVDKPTISYQPLQGEDFLKSVLSSISLEAILVMTESGWSVERIFGVCVERMNNLHNASSASGPTPEIAPKFRKFKRMLGLFRKLQKQGEMEIGPDLDLDSSSENLSILFEVEDVDKESLAELKKLLDFDTNESGSSALVSISSNFLKKRPNELTIRTRSISSVLFYLSQNIEAPAEHIAQGLVTQTTTPDGEIFDWVKTPAGQMLEIYSSESSPDGAFLAIPYRGYWFYIKDNDLNSKSTFMMLMQLFDLQAGQSKYSGPTLTLPVR
ncbi:MAG: hypothetical protein GQ582_01680 [Methyloprofundus sp.]|nr:hypothetical protein [Methyloprofundus sp.]